MRILNFPIWMLLVLTATVASATTINFASGTGVDGGVIPGPFNLGVTSLNLLGGSLSVDSVQGEQSGNLTYTAGRGIGIFGGSVNAEVDNSVGANNREQLTLSVLSGLWRIQAVELRSLFAPPSESPQEFARINVWNYSTLVNSVEVGGTSAADGARSHTFALPLMFTRIEFTVNDGRDTSDFTLAALELQQVPIPEPASLLLIGGGLLAVGLLGRRRFARKN